jgi:hypothetical protein
MHSYPLLADTFNGDMTTPLCHTSWRTPSFEEQETNEFYNDLANTLSNARHPCSPTKKYGLTATKHQNDVLCGRSSRAYRHPGNRRFRNLIAAHHRRYKTATTPQDKYCIADQVVIFIGARFLKENTEGNKWEQILGPEDIHRKVSHALRDARDHDDKTLMRARHDTSYTVPAPIEDSDLSVDFSDDENSLEFELEQEYDNPRPAPNHFAFSEAFDEIVPEKEDVLLGRERLSYKHPGNKRYRIIVTAYGHRYQNAMCQAAKNDITEEVVTMIGARFLERRRGASSSFWSKTCPEEVRKKIKHALRNQSNNKHTSRLSKSEMEGSNIMVGSFQE